MEGIWGLSKRLLRDARNNVRNGWENIINGVTLADVTESEQNKNNTEQKELRKTIG